MSRNILSKLTYKDGFKDGIPIALGYLFVSIGIGITAVNSGISVFTAVIISATNVTSAGQVAGTEIIAACTSILPAIFEMILTELVINIRYSLMSITLTQNLDSSFTTGPRLLVSFFITDEIFAAAVTKKDVLGKKYMYGLGTPTILGWILGTLIGSLLASFMPAEISNIFGIAIYGMFISIVVPPAKRERGILMTVGIAAAISCIIRFVPFLSFITSGFSVVISAVISSVIVALVFPVKEAPENSSNQKKEN